MWGVEFSVRKRGFICNHWKLREMLYEQSWKLNKWDETKKIYFYLIVYFIVLLLYNSAIHLKF